MFFKCKLALLSKLGLSGPFFEFMQTSCNGNLQVEWHWRGTDKDNHCGPPGPVGLWTLLSIIGHSSSSCLFVTILVVRFLIVRTAAVCVLVALFHAIFSFIVHGRELIVKEFSVQTKKIQGVGIYVRTFADKSGFAS